MANTPNGYRFDKGYTPWNKGKTLSLETRAKMSATRKGRKPSLEWRKNMAEAKRGSKSHLWKGGISPENERQRKTLDYRLWRTAVFERDNYTCQECGIRGQCGVGHRVVLHADHIKPFALFPELRLDVTNGRTLCVECHKKTDTYGHNKPKVHAPGASESSSRV